MCKLQTFFSFLKQIPFTKKILYLTFITTLRMRKMVTTIQESDDSTTIPKFTTLLTMPNIAKNV